LGAAYAAGLATGVWTPKQIFEDAEAFAKPTTFYPAVKEDNREKRYKSWTTAVERSFGLADLAL
jgi:glycerol kinase